MPDSGSTDRERIARDALLEITGAETVGNLVSESVESDSVVTMRLESTLTGYPGWHWSVSLADLPGESPTVLEVELMPGEGALLAPDWVPWSDRIVDADANDGLDEEDDDLDPDEVDDGLDFETDEDPDTGDPDPDAEDDSVAVPPVGVEQHDEAEAEADEDGPEPPRAPAVKKRWQRKKKSAQGE